MSYTPPTRNARIVFEEGHTYFGAEVTLSLDAPNWLLFDIAAFNDLSPADRQRVIAAFGERVLVDWNLEAPANAEGMREQPIGFISAILEEWGNLMAVPAPLVETSASTSTSAKAQSAATASPSPSQSESSGV